VYLILWFVIATMAFHDEPLLIYSTRRGLWRVERISLPPRSNLSRTMELLSHEPRRVGLLSFRISIFSLRVCSQLTVLSGARSPSPLDALPYHHLQVDSFLFLLPQPAKSAPRGEVLKNSPKLMVNPRSTLRVSDESIDQWTQAQARIFSQHR
jgi:hypothetical protein